MAESGISTVELVIVLILVAIVPIVTIAFYKTRYKKVPFDKAMVIYGRMAPSGNRGYVILSGGGKFIVPIVEEYQILDLSPRSAKMELRSVKIQVGDRMWGRASGAVTYSYSVFSDEPGLCTAAEHLLGLDMAEVSRMVEGYVEAAFKSFMASCPFPTSREGQELYVKKSTQFIRTDLLNIGIEVSDFNIDRLRLVEGG